MSDELPSFLEDHISQIPALQLLQNLGWQYLTPAEAVSLRGGKLGNVLLDAVLAEQLRKFNRIRFKGEHEFSEANVQSAILAIKDVIYDGLIRTSEKVYDLLVLGKSLQQTIAGDTKSFPLKYIDWNPESCLTNNVFHVTEEYEVERTASHETRRPDIVLFVNGIPLAVIECKRPDAKAPIPEAISQHLRNQRDSVKAADPNAVYKTIDLKDIDKEERDQQEPEIPDLFIYSQILLAISRNEAKYATTGTPAKFWAVWREEEDKELAALVTRPLTPEQKDRLFGNRFQYVRAQFDELEKVPREVTAQDQTLYSLCRPERLLDLTYNFVLFDAGEKKIARYQQFFTVKNAIERIGRHDNEGRRVAWIGTRKGVASR